jgi:hypothetical protein
MPFIGVDQSYFESALIAPIRKQACELLHSRQLLGALIGSQKRMEFPKGSITPVSSISHGVVSKPGRI